MLRKASLLLFTSILVTLLAFGGPYQIKPQSQVPPNTALINGKWFNDSSFEARTVYSVNSRFTLKKPSRVDRTLDLAGTYIVPPFGEAHTHLGFGLISDKQDKETIKRYLADGIFCVKVMGNLPVSAETIARLGLNRPDGLGVTFANGQLTCTGGHPIGPAMMALAQGAAPGYTMATMKDRRFFEIDSQADLERKWPLILSFHPDLIKVILWGSDEYEKRRNDPAFFAQRGIDPRLVPIVVEKAHQQGLRASAHVTTAADFHNALIAGVDEIAHVPRGLTPITEEDAKLAAKRGVVVDTTCAHVLHQPEVVQPKRDLPQILEAQKVSLKLLRDNGVELAIGSDDPMNDTSVREIEYLHGLGLFDNLVLLKMWTETTAKSIFPKRKMGALGEGYEASFLGLEGNPLEDLRNVRRIKFRFKQGFLLEW